MGLLYLCEFIFSMEIHIRQISFNIPSQAINFCYQLWNNKIQQGYQSIFCHPAQVARVFIGNKNPIFRPSARYAFCSPALNGVNRRSNFFDY